MFQTFIKFIPLAAIGVICTSCEKSVTGIYSGECHNITANAKGPIDITIKTTNDNIVTGYISITGKELYGSGELKGTINDDKISFNTPGDNDLMSGIQWTGTISGNVITGSYTVIPTANAQLLGIPVQYGTFHATKQ